MTREEAKELLPIIQAYADGRTILIKHDGEWFEPCDNTEICFSESPSDYRIKPEPKYRPFRTKEECWQEMHRHPDFGWVRFKETSAYLPIEKVSDFVNYTAIFEEYEFTDGTPFGIKEE